MSKNLTYTRIIVKVVAPTSLLVCHGNNCNKEATRNNPSAHHRNICTVNNSEPSSQEQIGRHICGLWLSLRSQRKSSSSHGMSSARRIHALNGFTHNGHSFYINNAPQSLVTSLLNNIGQRHEKKQETPSFTKNQATAGYSASSEQNSKKRINVKVL